MRTRRPWTRPSPFHTRSCPWSAGWMTVPGEPPTGSLAGSRAGKPGEKPWRRSFPQPTPTTCVTCFPPTPWNGSARDGSPRLGRGAAADPASSSTLASFSSNPAGMRRSRAGRRPCSGGARLDSHAGAIQSSRSANRSAGYWWTGTAWRTQPSFTAVPPLAAWMSQIPGFDALLAWRMLSHWSSRTGD